MEVVVPLLQEMRDWQVRHSDLPSSHLEKKCKTRFRLGYVKFEFRLGKLRLCKSLGRLGKFRLGL